MNPRRLYRSRRDRQLAGVAGGMAEYLEIDPTVVRILWILSAFLGGFTILLYVILAFVIPLEPTSAPAPAWWRAAAPAPGSSWGAQPAGTPGSEPAGEAGAVAGEAGVVPGEPGAASSPDGWSAPPAWAAPAFDPRPQAGRGGRGGLYLGVGLVVFGTIALATTWLPGWAAGAALWPALLLAVGIALLVGAIRRPADQR